MRLSSPPTPAVSTARLASLGATLLLATALAGCSKPAPAPPPAPAPVPMAQMDPVPTARACAKPEEKEAFDVPGLKTRLMVAALACGEEDKYNAFIKRNRPVLVTQDAKLTNYFNRAYGRGKQGQTEMDSYKTELANVQQQRRSRDAAFCQVSNALFGEALAAKSPADIGPLASSAPIDQPLMVSTCN